ncbi:MAG: hypothetical protein QOC87_1377 [Actinomycetota bacterium]|jgi:hypothetical protein|nr:hypothetical protein [Actinomycetota bacterium]
MFFEGQLGVLVDPTKNPTLEAVTSRFRGTSCARSRTFPHSLQLWRLTDFTRVWGALNTQVDFRLCGNDRDACRAGAIEN